MSSNRESPEWLLFRQARAMRRTLDALRGAVEQQEFARATRLVATLRRHTGPVDPLALALLIVLSAVPAGTDMGLLIREAFDPDETAAPVPPGPSAARTVAEGVLDLSAQGLGTAEIPRRVKRTSYEVRQILRDAS